jgi:hypothetical protein
LHDFGGRSNNGTLAAGMDPATDWTVDSGQFALDVDGVDNRGVSCGRGLNLLLVSQLSISGWFRCRKRSAVNGLIGNLNAGATGGFSLDIGRTANKLSWIQSGVSIDAVSTGTITDANWHHIALVRTGTTSAWTITFYIDGVSSSHSTAVNPPADPTLSGSLVIGRLGTFGGFVFDGVFDDIRIYNRGISRHEVQLLRRSRGIAYAIRTRRKSYSIPFDRRAVGFNGIRGTYGVLGT